VKRNDLSKTTESLNEANLATPLPDCFGIIPARFDSKRFPGKPLEDIHGKPMFWHVYDRARRCPELKRVYLATDDRRIWEAACEHRVPVLMTGSDHPSGSDRVMEAAEQLSLETESVVVNIQGDEPLLDPAMLSTLLTPFKEPRIQVTTLAHPLTPEDALDPDRVKVVCSIGGRALYFSRHRIPYPAGSHPENIWGHIGLYAFRLTCLRKFVSWPPSPLECTERLEQLRLLEHGVPIRVLFTDRYSRSVDTRKDLEIIRDMMKPQPHQQD
jgi:3-deoxy-manno-octulosonate cytidylyltransferase (CMP-KDO synthetase)